MSDIISELQQQALRTWTDTARGLQEALRQTDESLRVMRRILTEWSGPPSGTPPFAALAPPGFNFAAWLAEMNAIMKVMDEQHERAKQEILSLPPWLTG